jgi:DNA polymerase-3 subunit delta'
MPYKFDKLLLHPKTRLQVDYILKNPPQALMISAPSGSGKKVLTRALASQILGLKEQDIDSYAYFFRVHRLQNKSDISIEQIRAAVNKLRLKVPGSQPIRRLVFIEDAHFMNVPAQNALLKILEEPNPDTVFLLSVTSAKNVLPTIASRAQNFEILPVSLSSAKTFWQGQHSEAQIESAWRLSGGVAGLMSALLDAAAPHPLKEAVEQAKKFLRASKYERLLEIDRLSRNKDQFAAFVEALSRTLTALNHASVKAGRTKQAQALLHSRQSLQKIEKALQLNANPRLAALKLAISLKV